MVAVGGTDLVGRFGAVEEVIETLKRARSGQGGVLVFRGEQGIGKSRLLEETRLQATRMGFRVLSGRGVGGVRPLPFASLIHAFAPEARVERSNRRRALADLALSQLRFDSDSEGISHLHRSLTAIEDLLREWADDRPTLLVVDDLHATDPDTHALLAQLALRLADARLTIAVAVRPFPPDLPVALAEAIDVLSGAGVARIVELDPLDLDEVRLLAADVLGGPVDDTLASTLWSTSRGVPFFVHEAVRSLSEKNGVLSSHDGFHLVGDEVYPTLGHRSALIHRIFRLGADATTVIRALTVLDRFTLDRFDLLAEMTSLPPELLRPAIDQLVAARLVLQDEQEIQIVHPIVRNTLHVDLGPGERRRLHDVARRYLEQFILIGDDPELLLELAVHVANSAERNDAEAVDLLKRAGELTAHAAPATASEWYGAAADLLPNHNQSRAALLARRARAAFLASKHHDVVEAAAAAVDDLTDAIDRDRVAAIHVAALHALGHFDVGVAVADEYLEREPNMPRVRIERAAHLLYLERFQEGERQAEAVLAEQVDGTTRVRAIGQLTYAAFGQGLYSRCRHHVDQQLDASTGANAAVRLAALTSAGTFVALMGDTQRAQALLEQAGELARRLGGRAFGPELEAARAVLGYFMGDWERSLSQLHLAALSLSKSGDRAALALLRPFRAATLLERGELAQARVAMPVDRPDRSFISLSAWVSAGIDLESGDLDRARAQLEAALDADRLSGRMSAIPILVDRLVLVEDTAGRAERIPTLLEALDGLPPTDGAPWASAIVGRLRGRYSGEVDLIERALAQATRSGLVLEQIACHEALADLGHQSAEHLVAGRSLAVRVGAELRRRRLDARLRRRGTVARGAPVPDGLSTTQRQLALLIRDGRTNAEIARSLHLSPKTVEAYLTKLYRAFGCSGRVELAIAVEAGRLDDADSAPAP